MRHDKEGNQVDVQVTITPETADTQLQAATAAITGTVAGRMVILQPCAWYPYRIRTGATALKGRRPRPLDEGGPVVAGLVATLSSSV